jgi:N-acetylmuramoyl-L-alanine amidase
LRTLAHLALLASGLVLFGACLLLILSLRQFDLVVALISTPTLTPTPIKPTPRVLPTPTFTPTPLAPLVALLAGHSGGDDPGAVCPDGLREVDITTDVAARAKAILEARGYRVDILAEFDRRLDGVKRDYAPHAFLAIHADSCVYYASGYKVARAAYSASPQEDDRLVRCVSSSYAAASQLPFHEGSITNDMKHYHGLMKIHPHSPGAIIELGFMGSDRTVLMNQREQLALGIANGIERFLQGSPCK